MFGLTKYEPKIGIDLFDNVLDNFFDFENFIPLVPTNTLNYDVAETDKNYLFELMLPGFNKNDIKIDVKNASLIITAERKEKYNNYLKKESFYGKYKKLIPLPNKNVNIDSIEAKYENGVLKLILPKKEITSTKQKQIEIK